MTPAPAIVLVPLATLMVAMAPPEFELIKIRLDCVPVAVNALPTVSVVPLVINRFPGAFMVSVPTVPLVDDEKVPWLELALIDKAP